MSEIQHALLLVLFSDFSVNSMQISMSVITYLPIYGHVNSAAPFHIESESRAGVPLACVSRSSAFFQARKGDLAKYGKT